MEAICRRSANFSMELATEPNGRSALQTRSSDSGCLLLQRSLVTTCYLLLMPRKSIRFIARLELSDKNNRKTLSRLETSGRTQHITLMTEILKQQQHTLQVDDSLKDVKLQTSKTTTDLTQQISKATNTTGNHLHTVGKQILDFLGSFSSDFRDMLRKITQTDIRVYQLLLKIQQDIAANPMNLLNSNIHFEDALGRSRELPYQYFCH